MTPEEFKEVRLQMDLNQAQLAELLGYGSSTRVTELETGAAKIHPRIALLMQALADGWRPGQMNELRKARPSKLEKVMVALLDLWRGRVTAIGRDTGTYKQCSDELEAALKGTGVEL